MNAGQGSKAAAAILGLMVAIVVTACSGITFVGIRLYTTYVEARAIAEAERKEADEKRKETQRLLAQELQQRQLEAEKKRAEAEKELQRRREQNRLAEEERQMKAQEAEQKSRIAHEERIRAEQQMQREKQRRYEEREFASRSLSAISSLIQRWNGNIPSNPLVPNSEGQGSGLSWRVHLLPHIGQADLYKKFHLSEPWDSDHNSQWIASIPALYGSQNGMTRIRSVLKVDGPSPLSFGDVTDGIMQTAMLAFAPESEQIVWTRPDVTQPYTLAEMKVEVGDPLQLLLVSGQRVVLAQADEKLLAALQSHTGGEHLNESLWGRQEPNLRHYVADGGSAGIHQVEVPELIENMKTISTAFNKWLERLKASGQTNQGSQLSWQVHLLPYLGEEELFRLFRLEEPWHSEHNAQLIGKMPKVFGGGASQGRTRIQAVGQAVGTLSGPPTDFLRSDLNLGHQLALVYASPQMSATWTASGWRNVTPPTLHKSFGWKDQSPLLVGLANGEVFKLPSELHMSKLSALLVTNSKPSFNLEKELAAPTKGLKIEVPIQPAGVISGLRQLPEVTLPTAGLKAPVPMDPQSLNRLRKLGLAIHEYDSRFRRSPVAMKMADGTTTKLSWRVHILPMIDQTALYERFALDEAWDSPTNSKLLEFMPEIYRNTSRKNETSLHVLTGESSLLGSGRNWMSAATDGLQNTIMLMELPEKQATPWTQPDKHDVGPELRFQELMNGEKRLFATMGDGYVAQFEDLPDDIFRGLATKNGGELLDASSAARWSSAKRGEYLVHPQNRTQWEQSQLKQVAMAMLNYESAFRVLPPQRGQASNMVPPEQYQLSWRVHVLPFLGFQNLYNQFRLAEPWDSPHNIQLLKCMPDMYRDSADSPTSTETRVMVFSGPGTIFPEPGRAFKLGQVTDGISSTIGVVRAPAKIAVPWTKPEDFEIDTTNVDLALEELKKLRSPLGIDFAFLDGAVRVIPPGMDERKILACITPAGKEVVQLEELKP